MSKIDAIISRLYSHFISRDLVYVSGGLLILSVPFYSHGIVSELKNQPWWIFVLILIASYLLGFFAQETTVLIGLFRMFKGHGNYVEKEIKAIHNLGLIGFKIGNESVLRLERIIAIKHITSVIGSSALFTFLILQFYYYSNHLNITKPTYILISVFLLIYTFVMVVSNWRKAEVQDMVIEKWMNELNTCKESKLTKNLTHQCTGRR